MLNADEGVAFGATVMAGLVSGEDVIVNEPHRAAPENPD